MSLVIPTSQNHRSFYISIKLLKNQKQTGRESEQVYEESKTFSKTHRNNLKPISNNHLTMTKHYLMLLFVFITFIGAVPPNPTYRPSQTPSYLPTIYPTYSQNPTVKPTLRPTVTPNYHSVTLGVSTESTASFLMYTFLNGVYTERWIYPDAPLDAPYLHVALRSSYQYQIGYASDFNFSMGTIVDAPPDMYVDLPLIPPVPPDYVDQQEPGSSTFAHQLFGIALDGVPIYSGLIDEGIDFFHVIESASPMISTDSSNGPTEMGAGSPLSNMKVDFCGGSYGPTEPLGQGVRYHYRAMPTCLLPNNGQQSGTILKRQQFIDDIYQLLDAFSGIHGPHLLGYSLFGYPIYSPYDSRGLLQTDLDNCNGKFYNGSYAYFVSPTFPYIMGCHGPGVTSAMDVGISGEVLQSTIGTSFTACPGGHYPTPGSVTNGCKRCPAGRYSPVAYNQLPSWLSTGSDVDIAAYTCSGICKPGTFCPEASVRPIPCPAGRYGSSSELGTNLCSGACQEGYFCRPGSTSPRQYPCIMSTSYCPAGSVAQRAVTAGCYSVVPEDAPDTPATQLVRTDQQPCGPGTWCDQGKRYPCPAGTYGNTSFLLNSNCTAVCPMGSYCPQAATEPLLCPAGTFGMDVGLSDPSCSGLCSPGHYCPPGSTNSTQNICPGGIYGAEFGLISAQCSPVCEPGGAPNSTSPAADKYCVPRFCQEGYYCPPGSTNAQMNPCGGSNMYCPAGSVYPVTVDVGFYSVGPFSPPGTWQSNADNSTRTSQRQCEPGTHCVKGVRVPCPAGYYTDEYGSNSTTCKGPCSAGFYCNVGSSSPTQITCGSAAHYCPPGSATPLPTPIGYFSHKVTTTTPRDIEICPAGYYCIAGVKRPCPAGTFADGMGSHTPLCGGLCTGGYYCPLASTSRTMYPCPAGRFGKEGATSAACTGPCDQGYYCVPGSPTPQQYRCGGEKVYCPLGSSVPLNVSMNHFSTGGSPWTRSAQAFCNCAGGGCPSTTVCS